MDTEIMLPASEMLKILSMEVTVEVPDRDYEAMTPKDCYEAGLMDASTAVRRGDAQGNPQTLLPRGRMKKLLVMLLFCA
jgi:hypothetical protein